MGNAAADPPLLDRFRRGDRRALSRVITQVENRGNGYRDLLARLYPDTGRAYRLGITGPPGAGKSTLVDRLALDLASAGVRVGIIAVDPTSPFTGGALLGDRVRMGDLSDREHVFIRQHGLDAKRFARVTVHRLHEQTPAHRCPPVPERIEGVGLPFAPEPPDTLAGHAVVQHADEFCAGA